MSIHQIPIDLSIYNPYRKVVFCAYVQIPTKARSTKNLFGLAKNNQTREGIFYIFNDLILICSKEKKVKFKTKQNLKQSKKNTNFLRF